MPNDYARVRAARGGNEAAKKPALHEATPEELKKDPGVQQLKKQKAPEVKMGQGMKQVEPGDPGTGKYSDRIKIKPKFVGEQAPHYSDSQIQKIIGSQETSI